jgi:cytoskeleton protein RodZ
MKTPFGEAEAGPRQPTPPGQAVGSLLRRRREELGLDLDQVGDALFIKPAFLAALEDARPQDLPGPTYAVGFVRAYSHYLGLDSDLVLEHYKDAADAPVRPDLSLPAPLGARSMPGGRILLVGVILALCGYGSWYYISTGERSHPERVSAVPAGLEEAPAPIPERSTPPQAEAAPAPVRAAPDIAAAPPQPVDKPDDARQADLAAPPAPSWAAAPVESAPDNPAAGATPQPARANAAGGEAAAAPDIEIRAVADSWIQVRGADQAIVFSRVLKSGESYRVPHSGLLLRTGNAGALAITVGGKPAPALGPSGAVRRDVMLDPEALLTGKAARG